MKIGDTMNTDMNYSLPKYSHTGSREELPRGSKASSTKLSTGTGGKDKHNAPTSGGDGNYPSE
tara:strand:+ start:112 stop:300 length:189 start_codon:yes stop_codon:yes gene_type:complete